MIGYWIEIVDQTIGRVICSARIWTPELEGRVNALVAEYVQERLKDPGTHSVEVRARYSKDLND